MLDESMLAMVARCRDWVTDCKESVLGLSSQVRLPKMEGRGARCDGPLESVDGPTKLSERVVEPPKRVSNTT